MYPSFYLWYLWAVCLSSNAALSPVNKVSAFRFYSHFHSWQGIVGQVTPSLSALNWCHLYAQQANLNPRRYQIQLSIHSRVCKSKGGRYTLGKNLLMEQGITAQVPEYLKFPEGKRCQGKLDTRDPIRSSSWIETQHLPSQRVPCYPLPCLEGAIRAQTWNVNSPAPGQTVSCVMGTSDPERDTAVHMCSQLHTSLWLAGSWWCVGGHTWECRCPKEEVWPGCNGGGKKHDRECLSRFPLNISVSPLVNE